MILEISKEKQERKTGWFVFPYDTNIPEMKSISTVFKSHFLYQTYKGESVNKSEEFQ